MSADWLGYIGYDYEYVTIGTSTKLYIFNRKPGHKYRLCIAINSIVVYQTDWTQNSSILVTLPENIAEYIQGSNSVSAEFILFTHAPVGDEDSTSQYIKIRIAENQIPNFSILTTDPNGYFPDTGLYIQFLSQIRVDVVTERCYRSPIVSVTFQSGDIIRTIRPPQNNDSVVSITFEVDPPPNGLQRINVEVMDGRGSVNAGYVDVPVFAYQIPKSQITDLYRADANGNSNPQGEYANIHFIAECGNMVKDSVVYEIHYRERGTTAWRIQSLPEYSGQQQIETTKLIPLPTQKAYEFFVRVTEKYFSKDSSYRICPAGFILCQVNKETHAYSVGVAATKANTVIMGIPLLLQEYICLEKQTANDWASAQNWLDGLVSSPIGFQIFCISVLGELWQGFLFKFSATSARAELFSAAEHCYMTKDHNIWSDLMTDQGVPHK